jgi:hypothetical protein
MKGWPRRSRGETRWSAPVELPARGCASGGGGGGGDGGTCACIPNNTYCPSVCSLPAYLPPPPSITPHHQQPATLTRPFPALTFCIIVSPATFELIRKAMGVVSK